MIPEGKARRSPDSQGRLLPVRTTPDTHGDTSTEEGYVSLSCMDDTIRIGKQLLCQSP